MRDDVWMYALIAVLVCAPVAGVMLAMITSNPVWLLLCLTLVFLAS